jgi:hypothetical protein
MANSVNVFYCFYRVTSLNSSAGTVQLQLIALTGIGYLKVVSNELACRSVFKERDVLYFRALSKHCKGGVQEAVTLNNRFISRKLNCRTSGCDAEVPVNDL